MRIREISSDDETLARRFWEIGRAADEQGRPWSGYWSWEAARASFHASLAPDAPNTKVLLGAYDGETMVGAAELNLPRRDNTHVARLEMYVDPPHQRYETEVVDDMKQVHEMQKRLGRP